MSARRAWTARRVWTGRALAAAAALLVLGAGGCRKDAARGAAAPARPKVALVMKSLANGFFKTMEEGARRHQQARPDRYDLVTNGIKDEQDVGKQIDLVEQMVAQGVDAIVLAPADSKALVGAVKRAREAGVVVVNIDNRLDPEVMAARGLRVPFVGPDNRKGARLAGEHLARALRPGDAVAILDGLPTADNAIQRRAGFLEAVEAAGLTVVARQAAHWEMGRANQVAAALLTEHPQLKAFLCANDSMALGAVAAVRAANRVGQVHVVGFDNISAAAEALRKGELLATVEQHGGELAVFGIEYALEILSGKAAPEDRVTPVEVVTAEAPR
jgi:ribose transport system substrate-binding protein